MKDNSQTDHHHMCFFQIVNSRNNNGKIQRESGIVGVEGTVSTHVSSESVRGSADQKQTLLRPKANQTSDYTSSWSPWRILLSVEPFLLPLTGQVQAEESSRLSLLLQRNSQGKKLQSIFDFDPPASWFRAVGYHAHSP